MFKPRIILFVTTLIGLISAGIVRAEGDEGFIYGKVTTRQGSVYQGIIRWGTQEFFWDDLFNATKIGNPWMKYVKEERKKNPTIKIMGFDIYTDIATHQFVTRFGDIDWIEVKRNETVIMHMKGGSAYEVEGYGDIGAELEIYDQSLGAVDLNWEKISKIEFMDTPKTVKKPGSRLYGTLKTPTMIFTGYIMWDAEECVTSDILDGESKDGMMKIEFGNIRSVKRRSSSSCSVTLKDGREITMEGTNDVDSDNRGIYIEDNNYGKVEVSWGDFTEVVFKDNKDSGDPYRIYKSTGKLKGTVKANRQIFMNVEIVFDLDENEGFEILDGQIDDIKFYIPFRQIVSIVPKGVRYCSVKLINGEELLLEGAQDVSASNDGVILMAPNTDIKYYKWETVEEINFEVK